MTDAQMACALMRIDELANDTTCVNVEIMVVYFNVVIMVVYFNFEIMVVFVLAVVEIIVEIIVEIMVVKYRCVCSNV